MVSQTPPILVVGTGAMASLFAARFSASGLSVRMLGTWVESIETLNKFGVRFIDEDGQESAYPVEATDDPEKCVGSQFAIILVKSYQTQGVALRLAKCLADDGLALTLQNGLDNHRTLAEVLGEQRVASGVTTAGASLIEPGIVRTGGKGVISLGNHKKLKTLVNLLMRAGFEVETVEGTDSLIWGKLVINAAINPLTALLKVPNGDLLEIPPARKMMNLVTIETADVASALEISLPFSDPVSAVESVALRTASNYSSMYKDVSRGSQTEIDAINGAIVRIGETASASVDFNRMLWLLVKAMTMKSSA
ncbi:MAG: 2-dehydropantoate 2-reductase [Chloroflexi bacterium]|nr:2-dehydropantoate 2-reductase [Chloroflexota bacterium]